MNTNVSDLKRSSLFMVAFITTCFTHILNAEETESKMKERAPAGLHIITLGVSNLKKSYKFYKVGLGFPTEMTPDGGIVLFTTAGAKMFLYPYPKLAGDIGIMQSDKGPDTQCFSGITFAHCALSREEVDEILAKAKRAGGKIVKPAKDTFWGGYSGYFSDPDGYYWEVAFAPNWHFSADGSVIFETQSEQDSGGNR